MTAHGYVEGYEIELDTTGRSYGRTKPTCFVRHGRFSSSLEDLSRTEQLLHRNGEDFHVVPAYLIGAIEQWARERGYPI